MQGSAEFGGRFSVDRRIAAGERATLYRARDQQHGGRGVLLHVVSLKKISQARLERAVRQLGELRRLSHPMLVPVLDGGLEHECFFIATPAVTAQSLRVTLEWNEGLLPLETSVGIFFAAAAALEALHGAGIVHARLSAESVLLTEHGILLSSYLPTALDEVVLQSFVEERQRVAPAYLAPEALYGKSLGSSIDLYALAALLYELVTGEQPAVRAAAGRGEPQYPAKLNSALGPLLDAAIIKGLAADPAERFQSVGDFAHAVRAACERQGLVPRVFEGGAANGVLDAVPVTEEPSPPAPPARPDPEDDDEPASLRRQAVVRPVLEIDRLQLQPPPVPPAANDASMIMLNGPLRGERFWLESDLVMIGGDPQCGIHLEADGVASHHAVISQREKVHLISSLAPGVLLNGKPLEGSSELQLSNGDVVQVGASKFRFLAPDAEAPPAGADSARSPVVEGIGRESPSRWTSIALMLIAGGLAIAGIAVLVVVGLDMYRSREQRPVETAAISPAPTAAEAIDAETPATTFAPEQVVAPAHGIRGELIRQVRTYRLLGQIGAPRGANAAEVLVQLAERFPTDMELPSLVREVAAETVHSADIALQMGFVERSKRWYISARALGVDAGYLAERIEAHKPPQAELTEFVAVLRKIRAPHLLEDHLSRAELDRSLAAVRTRSDQ